MKGKPRPGHEGLSDRIVRALENRAEGLTLRELTLAVGLDPMHSQTSVAALAGYLYRLQRVRRVDELCECCGQLARRFFGVQLPLFDSRSSAGPPHVDDASEPAGAVVASGG